MERILVTTDFSDESKRAIGPAVDLAKKLGLGITLLSVVVDLRTAPQGAPLAPPLSSPTLGTEVEEARTALAGVAGAIEGVDVTTDVLTAERVVAAIAEYSHSHDIAMIAISTHGRTGWRNWVLGSVTEELCRHAPVPVVVLPRPADPT